jgi:AraC-like DNA-binding protein
VKPTLVTRDMFYWRVQPDPRLRSRIQCYWVMEGAKSIVPSKELLIPDGLSEIVLNLDGTAFQRWKLDTPDRQTPMRHSYVIGGRSHSIGTFSSETMRLAGVKLDPRVMRTLIGTHLNEFRDETLSLSELGFKPLLELEDAAANLQSAEQIVELFDEFFLRALGVGRPVRDAVDALLQRIHADRGATSIMRWADDAGIDARGLERAFCAATGMTPKQYARVIRFKRTYRELIGRERAAPLSAQLDGFYDQSHFNREFRFFTGVAPTVKLKGRMDQGMIVSDHLLQAEPAS